MRPKYVNDSHQVVIETLENAGVKIKNPIMLTTTQDKDYYSISCDYICVGINIPKEYIDEDEIKSIPRDLEHRFVLNKVWDYKG